MKTRILTLSIMLSVIFGCSKSTQLPSLEIHPNGDKTTIEQKLEGVSLKFCILNQYGEPATVFNKGENFTFNFSIYNHEKDTIKISTDFINDDFYRVFNTSENSDMGKSWTGVWCNYSLQPQEIEVPPSQNRELKCPWMLLADNTLDYPLCMSESKTPLEQGEYYTKLNLDFEYSFLSKKKKINDISYFIYFRIQ